jgi:NhaP-type Na+/H+ or K+/H+ antiporter
MTISLTLQLAALVALGFAAQWLAWRVRLPAILFLLLIGLVLGPGLGWFDPDAVLGPMLFPFISLGVAVVLFEGSLSLRFDELGEVGLNVLRLVIVGGLTTVAVLAVAAHWLAGLSWELAALFGALTCVTGPTVIVPMLRSVRPNARIARVLLWEGIVIDPLGALFAVLVYEAIVTHQQGHSFGVFGLTVLVGAACGGGAAAFLALVLRHRWLPDYLQTFGALALVLCTFAGANELAHESGLLAVTLMGMILANLRGLMIDEILNFKEHLSTLLISALFILLAARLPWPLPAGTLTAGLGLLLVAQFVARPLAVLLSSIGGNLRWRERALVAWIAPRGIVAAAVAALFALRLQEAGQPGAGLLVPLTFVLIIGTVVVQSATAAPLARALGVVEPNRHGALIIGANRVARTLAKALDGIGVATLLVDDDWFEIRAARMQGLKAWYGDPLSEHAERMLDLTGLGQMLAMSTRREINSLACVRWRPDFGAHKVFRLRILGRTQDSDSRREHATAFQVPILFGDAVTHASLDERIEQGWRIKTTRLSEAFGFDKFLAEHGADAVPLFSVDEQGRVRMAEAGQPFAGRPGMTVTALVAPQREPAEGASATATATTTAAGKASVLP